MRLHFSFPGHTKHDMWINVVEFMKVSITSPTVRDNRHHYWIHKHKSVVRFGINVTDGSNQSRNRPNRLIQSITHWLPAHVPINNVTHRNRGVSQLKFYLSLVLIILVSRFFIHHWSQPPYHSSLVQPRNPKVALHFPHQSNQSEIKQISTGCFEWPIPTIHNMLTISFAGKQCDVTTLLVMMVNQRYHGQTIMTQLPFSMRWLYSHSTFPEER